MQKKNTVIGILFRADDDLKNEIRKRAKKMKIPLSMYCREALRQFLASGEDLVLSEKNVK